MTDDRILRNAVHRDMDPRFFTDYALFSGAFRHYVGKSIEDEYRRSPNDIHKRLLIVGLYREEYSAYEDLGAVLDLPRFRGQFSVLVSDLDLESFSLRVRQQRSLAPKASEALECGFAQGFADALVRS